MVKRRYALIAAVGIAAALLPLVAARASVPPCPAGVVCVDVTPSRGLGPVDLVAQGFLFGVDGSTSQTAVNALRPTSWRSTTADPSFTVAQNAGAVITEVLSNLWYNQHGPTDPPWSNFSVYATWVNQTVADILASGKVPDWWEVQNEPDGWYQSVPPETTQQALQQYQIASTIIRSLDPAARIEGPSLLGYFATPGQSTIDMTTFLSFVAANRLPLDAVSWHEVIGTADTTDPNIVITHVAQARALMAKYPALAHLPIFINEYDANADHLIPGWQVGWISALEAAGVAQATRACWHEPDVRGKMIAECGEGSLDGLFQPGSGRPQDLYWVHNEYAQMTGERVAVSSTDPAVSGYATFDSTTETIHVLVGRHASCTAAVRVDCKQPASATPPPEPIMVRVLTPSGWTGALARTDRIANVVGPEPEPMTSFNGLVTGSPLSVGLGPVADGDAYGVMLSGV